MSKPSQRGLYGSPEWKRIPGWRRFIARFWFVIVIVLWVILFSACAGDSRPDTVDPRADVEVHVINNNWLQVNVYTWVNEQRARLGEVSTANERTFTLPRTIAHHPDLRFLIDPVGGTRTHLTESVLVGTGQRIIITVANNLALTTVIVR